MRPKRLPRYYREILDLDDYQYYMTDLGYDEMHELLDYEPHELFRREDPIAMLYRYHSEITMDGYYILLGAKKFVREIR